jgi:hypothetical protein
MSNDERIKELEREKRGLEEMLFFVLESVGEPVYVTKEQMTRGAGPDKMISIEDDVVGYRFIFSVSEVPNGQDEY